MKIFVKKNLLAGNVSKLVGTALSNCQNPTHNWQYVYNNDPVSLSKHRPGIVSKMTEEG